MKTSWASLLLCLGLLSAAPLPTSAAPAAEPVKTLRYIFPAAETGFDPATARDLYSAHVTQAVFETLYTYDYLARPAKLAPLTAAALPEVSADGKTYTIRLKHGIMFTQDPAFKGRPRELTMADYVYSWKRVLDPKMGAPHAWLFAGKVIGFDKLALDAKKTGKFDYDAKVEGFEVVDPYTLRIHLTQTDFNLGMILAHDPT
jgi:oligopeptide transport system substrate-binding protein